MEQNNLVFEVDGLIYELIYNFKDAFQREAFEEKLVDVLKNKPYIVGDISHDKLRLSGFILTKDVSKQNKKLSKIKLRAFYLF